MKRIIFTTLLLLCAMVQTAWADTVETYYIDAQGTRHDVKATVLTGTEDLTPGCYVVNTDVTIDNTNRQLFCSGDLNLILADGKTFSITSTWASDVINASGTLNIYGQTEGTGTLNVHATGGGSALFGNGVNIAGGIVNATSDRSSGILSGGNVTISGGQVCAQGTVYSKGIYTLGGSITLGWRTTADKIYASGYFGDDGISIAKGHAFWTNDATPVVVSGTIEYSKNYRTAIDGKTLTPAYFSEDGADTYTIYSNYGWEVFCEKLATSVKGIFTGKTVRLANDITVSSMAGNVNYDFTGTFDGQGYTLTFNATATDNYCAPFRYVQGTAENAHAVIKNLNVKSTITGTGYKHLAGLIAMQSGYVDVTGCNVEVNISSMKGSNNTALYPAAIVSQANNTSELTISGCTATGTIATDGQYAGGIIGIVQQAATIQNCLSSVTISSSTIGDGTHGGLVASQPSNTSITIEGCVFNGKLLGEQTNACGGFVGYRNGSASITNSLFAPAEVKVSTEGSATFARNWDGSLTNCYYTQPFGTVQGKQTRAITVSGNVTATITPTGTSEAYNVSGITAYSSGGLMYGGTCYCGSDDQVNVLLSPNDLDAFIAGCAVTPEGVTLTAQGDNSYTLTMPDAEVTIEVTLAEGDGTADNPYIVSDWSTFCSWVADHYDVTKNKHFKLAADLTATTMAGTEAQPFCGTFDGDGHTLTLSFGSAEQPFNEQYCAPFRYVGHATIKNLHVDGAITTSGYDSFAAGFVGMNVENADGLLTIENCRSSVTITNNTITGNSGGVFIAGFIGQNQRTEENQSIINHCVFDGKLLAPNGIGVAGFFFGLKNTYNYTYHSFFAPVETQRTPNYYSYCVNFGTRCPINNVRCNQVLTDCYYTQVLGELSWQSKTSGSPGVLLYNSGVPATANDGVISRVDGETFDTKLLDRTLYKDGSWNTLCLPFGLNTLAGTPLDGATVKELTASSFDSETGTLTLTFSDALNAIEAGKPYLVRWDKPASYTPYDGTNAASCSDVVDPVFTGCVISKSTGSKVTPTDRVDFVGSFSPVQLEAGDKTVLYLGGDNKLYYPSEAMEIGSCRAYFKLGKGLAAGDPAPANIRNIVLNVDGNATAIDGVSESILREGPANGWYTLDGRRLSRKPTQRGIYIHGGKKVSMINPTDCAD